MYPLIGKVCRKIFQKAELTASLSFLSPHPLSYLSLVVFGYYTYAFWRD
ncbi:hypothetical protein caldi_13890 [Caldinitratiruptor microaerophilus]|uniref:Uncharacterized protein n=1 Tax=Caldinitratiruptor microaerophilus TaxID=671077 RepID=A0AA35CJ86_9FIRM|nr:hypothetical protein caldi_13890 [Caldinitratiruptor microaerophilus]